MIKILFLAQIQVHTATAVGVASQRASGHAITMAEIAKFRDVIIPTFQNKYQLKKVIIQDKTANITKYQAALSAKRCHGAFEFWAVCTSLIIWERTVSDHTPIAL